MKKIRLLPAFVTLLAGAITSITLYVLRVDILTMLLILLAVLLVFYVLGVIAMKIIMDCPPKEKEESPEADDGTALEADENAERDDAKAKDEKK